MLSFSPETMPRDGPCPNPFLPLSGTEETRGSTMPAWRGTTRYSFSRLGSPCRLCPLPSSLSLSLRPQQLYC